ncbi:MAG: TraB/GumN family protein [Flavobacteriaceae bacterium]|jgi:uncharacterized protein YbaP (TraB family)|nr:TraB/GumN family protein [Flavobacteriaceae bacterium]
MKKTFFLSFLILFNFVFSQEIKEKALLWEISGNGLSQPSYLFGTIHIACEGEVEMRPEMQNAFDKTEQLILEMKMDDPSLMPKMMQASLATDGKTVSDKLGTELASKVDSLMTTRMGMSLAMFENLNLTTISIQVGLLAINCPVDLGYDMMLLNEAKTDGKEIKGLESIEAQIQVLLSMSEEEALQSINYIVNHFEESEEELLKMLELYRNQEVQGLYNFTKESMEDPKYPQGNMEDLLYKRNENWIPVIEKEIRSTPSFIAVGAAHLAGERGVIHLLRNQGYTLSPVFK